MNNNTTDSFWNDDLVKEYTHDVIIKALNERTVSPCTWDEQIFKFRQSKLQQPKEEQGVKVLGFSLSSPPHKETVYCLHLNQLIHHEKYEAVKKAISDCLNEDHPKEKLDNPFFGMGYSFFNHPNSISITKEQLDAMMENVWNAARDVESFLTDAKYPTFQDYQQSLPENKPETHTTSNASLKCQNDKLPSCCMCGGETVLIRGKYPGTDKRNVCPTCNTERLEQISEISSKDYGQNYKANN